MAITQLKLDYDFIPDPNPIRAADPNKITLGIMIDNPGPGVTVQKIDIEIPMGSSSSNVLSTARDLPPPSYDTSVPWKITSAGSLITITPAIGSSAEVTAIIYFTLSGIQVSETEGPVQITITEFYAGGKIINGEKYTLEKLPADFPVKKFYAADSKGELDPPVLYDLDQKLTLYWECTDQGQKGYAYSVRTVSDDPSEVWQPRDCLNAGTCFSCDDGTAGVPTPKVQETTTYALDVITADPKGGREISKTISTTVRMVVPSVSGNSYLSASYFSGQVVRLNWIAYHASGCAVEFGDTVLVDNAPTDTYDSGYVAVLSNEPGMHQLAVTAHARFGTTEYRYTSFPEPTVKAPATVPVGSGPQTIAVTPDGKLAFVTNFGDGNVTVIDIEAGTVKTTIPVGALPKGVAVTPDGKLALVTNTNDNNVSVIDVGLLTTLAGRIAVGAGPQAIAITPNSALAFVGNFNESNTSAIDINARQAKPMRIPAAASGIAITPDGALALLTSPGGYVTVVDVGTLMARPNTIPVGSNPGAIAITPDGTLALVANYLDNNVSVIDLSTFQVDATIPVIQLPGSIAITPDSSLALVVGIIDNSVSVIDIRGRVAAAQRIDAGGSPASVAITGDGKRALVLNNGANNVKIF